MRTTMDIPDSLYRRVRSRTALEGTTLRSVTITLYSDWLSRPTSSEPSAESVQPKESPLPSWAGLCAASITKNADGPHDMESIRRSISSANRLAVV